MEAPLLRVSRPVAACARCRSAKIKCDGKMPACTSCIKSNRASECSNSNDIFSRGKERSYVAMLESRIDKFQKHIAEFKQNERLYARAAAHAAASAAVSIARRALNPNTRRDSGLESDSIADAERCSHELEVAESRLQQFHHPLVPVPALDFSHIFGKRKSAQKEASDVDDLVSGFGFLAVNSTVTDYGDMCTSFSFAKLILNASIRPNAEPLPTAKLPEYHEALVQVQFYMNTIYLLLPFIDEYTIYHSLEAVYNKPDVATPFNIFVLRISLAIASVSEYESFKDEKHLCGLGHLRAALDCADQVLRPGRIQALQAALFLAEYASFDPSYFDNWVLIGIASRLMIDLGIHQDPVGPTKQNMRADDLELRRRIFYSVYTLDRSISSLTQRAFSFSDSSCNVAMPFVTDMKEAHQKTLTKVDRFPRKAYDTAKDFFRLRQIQSISYTQLHRMSKEPMKHPYRYIWKLYNDLTSWFGSIRQTANHQVMRYFAIELVYGYITILAPSPRCPDMIPYSKRLAFEQCLTLFDIFDKVYMLQGKDPKSYRTAVVLQSLFRLHKASQLFMTILSNCEERILESESVPAPAPPPPVLKRKISLVTYEEAEADPSLTLPEIKPPAIPNAESLSYRLGMESDASPRIATDSDNPVLADRPPAWTDFPEFQKGLNRGEFPPLDYQSHYVTRSIHAITQVERMMWVFCQKFNTKGWHTGFVNSVKPILRDLLLKYQSIKEANREVYVGGSTDAGNNPVLSSVSAGARQTPSSTASSTSMPFSKLNVEERLSKTPQLKKMSSLGVDAKIGSNAEAVIPRASSLKQANQAPSNFSSPHPAGLPIFSSPSSSQPGPSKGGSFSSSSDYFHLTDESRRNSGKEMAAIINNSLNPESNFVIPHESVKVPMMNNSGLGHSGIQLVEGGTGEFETGHGPAQAANPGLYPMVEGCSLPDSSYSTVTYQADNTLGSQATFANQLQSGMVYNDLISQQHQAGESSSMAVPTMVVDSAHGQTHGSHSYQLTGQVPLGGHAVASHPMAAQQVDRSPSFLSVHSPHGGGPVSHGQLQTPTYPLYPNNQYVMGGSQMNDGQFQPHFQNTLMVYGSHQSVPGEGNGMVASGWDQSYDVHYQVNGTE